ncbi:conserved hypothetical protein [Methanolacinia petrolearia DSM 11571]|uniref:Uncharacterized protein n=1 Tax=Methanolacinia petrolearia (strain DSM 11571 / OCM 486 / SEBR 4847) TaxID=679926 RepID=E1RJB9_METP4|nr:hypothetical protein [Methanolacinia petrolearia]ADN35637.1 conserved hypothetical protein [Methanolacinia petrolearia DSM 11571]
MLYETLFLQSLIFTLIVEVPLLFVAVRYVLKSEKSVWDILATGLLMTALTLPYLWFVMPPYLDMSWYPLNAEIIVILVESAVIWYLLRIKPLYSVIISAFANAASYLLGVLLL